MPPVPLNCASVLADTEPPPPADFIGPLEYVTIDGFKIVHRRVAALGPASGDACAAHPREPPLVMLLGYGGTMAQWGTRLLRRLAQRRELILVDYPAQGLSEVRLPLQGVTRLRLHAHAECSARATLRRTANKQQIAPSGSRCPQILPLQHRTVGVSPCHAGRHAFHVLQLAPASSHACTYKIQQAACCAALLQDLEGGSYPMTMPVLAQVRGSFHRCPSAAGATCKSMGMVMPKRRQQRHLACQPRIAPHLSAECFGQALSSTCAKPPPPLQFALGFIKALGLRRPHLAGFSLGGCIALKLAAEHPEAVGKARLTRQWCCNS